MPTPDQPPVDLRYLFRRIDPDLVLQRVRKMWDLESSPFPLPRFVPVCPACNATDVLYRRCKFHRRKESTSSTPFRADVGFKCCRCSYAWTFGVVITKEMYEKPRKSLWTRREIKEVLEDHESVTQDWDSKVV